ncbi:asparagine synthase (glutamine-hydrolyzing) [Pelagibacterium sp. H642]|uniref:asparagine synthase (glutamine-hydrolyzing) n=1 Tax=Pelagibacterium sp. H642 TaxID=1881069 RepID=UPI0028152C0D|nr:asparagine synthase (glutamine-hydrolyzing) [Pelagibacterium sp. H642]WMT90809.1 asparagine synthase (glutamine-hydrolyzing) [Pelagibacterium sp. H642]
MCGIAGYRDDALGAPEGLALLVAMTRAIAHRGPDAAGHWAEAGIGLGHRRLSIIGLADGQQPMADPEAGLMLSYNGEVFNFPELRAELEKRGHRFRTHSDTEVILKLYREYGADCVSHINGDFAFALWDRPNRRLLLARDRMGVRPLYWARTGTGVVFASEAKALFCHPQLSAELDPLALDQIFTLWSPLAPRTIFKGIFELPPAHLMLFQGGKPQIRPYWQLDYPDEADAPQTGSAQSVAEEVLDLLTDATRIRLRADVPVGSYLSGGLDSAIVAALAAREKPDGLSTFSVAFESAEYDESAYQREMVSALGTEHAQVLCRNADIADVFPDVVHMVERPVLRTAPAPLHLLSALVRAKSYKVVLTGEGADEVFAGYDIFKEAKVRRFCARDPKSQGRALLFKRLYPYLPELQKQNASYLAAYFGVEAARLDDPLFSHRPRFRSTSAAKLFFSADFKATLAGYDAAEELAAQLPARFGRWHPLHQAQFLETRYLLPGYILSAQGDRMAMAHGVEGRFPFLDHRLIELAAGISPALKLRGLEEKHILRRATAHLMPKTIGRRTKQPYRAPDSAAFAASDAPYVAAALSRRAVAQAGMFNPDAVQKLQAKLAAGKLSGFRDNAGFVGVLSGQLWHGQFSVTNTLDQSQPTYGRELT